MPNTDPGGPPSSLVVVSFVALVVVMLALLVFAVSRAATRRSTVATAALGTGWLSVTGALASRGALSDFSLSPPPLMRIVLLAAVVTLILAFTKFGERLVRALPLWGLVAFQVFRVPVELLLFALHREGLIPGQMTFEGMNFDVVSGVLAVVVAILAKRGTLPRSLLLAWNVTGLALLLAIVVIANLSAPGSLRPFHDPASSALLVQFPFVWLPAFLVPAALFGHVLVFRWASLFVVARGGEGRPRGEDRRG